MALWDIIGKACGQPLYKLWGGYTDRVRAYASTMEVRKPEQRAEDALRFYEEGWRAIKVRIHDWEMADDIRPVEAVRKAVGDRMEIMVDANQAQVPGVLASIILGGPEPVWDFQRALDTARELQRLGVRWLEEPLDRYDWEGLAKLCEMVEIPIAGGENNLGLHELRWMIERNVYDIIQLECQRNEGISQIRKIAGLAEMHHKLVVPHTGWEAFGFLAHVHLAAAVPNSPYVEVLARATWLLGAGLPDHPGRATAAGRQRGHPGAPEAGIGRGASPRPPESRLTKEMTMSLPESMKAVVTHGPQDYRLEEVPVPQIGPGEVLVRDKGHRRLRQRRQDLLRRRRVWGSEQIEPYIETPVIAGHEFVGEVVALGEGAAEKYGLALGDLAVSEQIVPCWQCRFCQRGQYWMCQRHDIYGFKHGRAEGSWAEYMQFPAGAINHKVPPEVKPEHAALIEPLACAIHAVERGEIQLGRRGGHRRHGAHRPGHAAGGPLKSPGPAHRAGPAGAPLQLARELGADLALNPAQEDAIQRVLDLTDGYGCDVYIEATGAEAAVVQGLQMIRKLGTFVEFSVHAGPATVDWSIIGDQKELNVHGAHLGPLLLSPRHRVHRRRHRCRRQDSDPHSAAGAFPRGHRVGSQPDGVGEGGNDSLMVLRWRCVQSCLPWRVDSMEQVKFGVIGAGGAWSFHSNACAESSVLKFVSVYDINESAGRQGGERYRVNEMKAYGDLQEFLHSEIDAVLVMVPHAYHEEIVVQCAAAGKHVLCEKPMATTLEGCDMMIKATRDAGVKFMIAENHRFLPAHQYIHDAIRDGLVGDVFLVGPYEGVNEIPGLSQPDFWKGDPIKAGGGCLMDMGAHKFAALEWMLDDEVESVTAVLAKQAINLPEKAEDNALAMVRFAERRPGRNSRQLHPDGSSLQQPGGLRYQGHHPGKPHVGQAGADLFAPRGDGRAQAAVVRAGDRTRAVSRVLQHLRQIPGRILCPLHPRRPGAGIHPRARRRAPSPAC